jgi:hypothetical protein
VDASQTYGNLESQLLISILCGDSVENSGKLLSVELDCISQLMAVLSTPGKRFRGGGDGRPTVNNSSDDGVNLALLLSVGGCKAGAECRGEVLLDGLEGANACRAAEVGACAQDPAAIPSN